MTLPVPDYTVRAPSPSKETPESTPQKTGKEQKKSSIISPHLLASALPPTPRRSPRQPSARDSTNDIECLGSPSPASRKRKRGETTESESLDLAAKLRRISDSSGATVVTGSGESSKVEASEKTKTSKDGKIVKHEKKADYFDRDEGYRYMAWPLVDSADARALKVPECRQPLDITPMGLENFEIKTIFQSPIFSKARTFAGMDDLKRVYAEVGSWTASTSTGKFWSEGISNLAFLAGQLFLPKEIFLLPKSQHKVQDSKSGNKTEPMGPLIFYNRPLDRNYLIAIIVSLSTGILFDNKMISSHQQHIRNTLKAKAKRASPAGRKRLSEIIDLIEFGSPTAHNDDSMSDYIASVQQLRKAAAAVKGKAKAEKKGIPLKLHPCLAFLINCNGSFTPGRPQPENRLIDVSDKRQHRLSPAFAWGWHFWCRGLSVPDGEHKEREAFPFGDADAPLARHRFYSPADIEGSGNNTNSLTERSSLESVEESAEDDE